jgi:hypothetical protein
METVLPDATPGVQTQETQSIEPAEAPVGAESPTLTPGESAAGTATAEETTATESKEPEAEETAAALQAEKSKLVWPAEEAAIVSEMPSGMTGDSFSESTKTEATEGSETSNPLPEKSP